MTNQKEFSRAELGLHLTISFPSYLLCRYRVVSKSFESKPEMKSDIGETLPRSGHECSLAPPSGYLFYSQFYSTTIGQLTVGLSQKCLFLIGKPLGSWELMMAPLLRLPGLPLLATKYQNSVFGCPKVKIALSFVIKSKPLRIIDAHFPIFQQLVPELPPEFQKIINSLIPRFQNSSHFFTR